MKRIAFVALFAFVVCHAVAAIAAPTSVDIWDLQAVDADGNKTHPLVGAPAVDRSGNVIESNKVVVEGIVLNASAEYLDPSVQFQIFVQGESPDAGGVAAWNGSFFFGGKGSDAWLDEYDRLNESGFQPGDRVRVTGFALFHNGKSNINSRHSAAPHMAFTIELLEAGVGLPTPTVLPGVAASTLFDQTRATGGERYQGTWCRLENVGIVGGAWENDGMVLVTDNGTDTIPVHLSAMGDFDLYSAPTGPFSVTGVFNQEDGSAPYTGDYRLWVKSYSDFSFGGDDTAAPVPEPSALVLAMMGLGAGLARNKRRTM
jgi:hypothetical protein